MALSQSEQLRRKRQSIAANPDKYYRACLKKGCCKNCGKNVQGKRAGNSGTVFGSYLANSVPGFSGAEVKFRKCAATGERIVNEYNRCRYWVKQTDETGTTENNLGTSEE